MSILHFKSLFHEKINYNIIITHNDLFDIINLMNNKLLYIPIYQNFLHFAGTFPPK